MEQILVLGAGQSSAYLIDKLLGTAALEDWFVTVADMDLALAKRCVGRHTRGDAIRFDINDSELRSTQIEIADIVINMLPAKFQGLIAWDCVSHGTPMISVSYRDQDIRDLDADARRKGVMLLCEMGLDPGIDHMSTMDLINSIRKEGGKITGFCSYGSGIPAPNQPHNPLRYVITWDPRNVVMSGSNGAQYMEDGQIKIVPFHQVFHHTWDVEVEGVGRLEAYANRDSLSYMQTFGLEDVKTMIRGTLRYPGWSETWVRIVQLGLPNETLRIPNLGERTYAEVVKMFLPLIAEDAPLPQRIARYLNISPTGVIMEKFRWLGLLSDEKIGCEGDTAAAMLIHILKNKLPLLPGERDAVVLVHQLDVEYEDRPSERRTSTLVMEGEPNGFTAMSKAVGLPVALAVKLMLRGELPMTGAHLPTHPSIYGPILRELNEAGLGFTETVQVSE